MTDLNIHEIAQSTIGSPAPLMNLWGLIESRKEAAIKHERLSIETDQLIASDRRDWCDWYKSEEEYHEAIDKKKKELENLKDKIENFNKSIKKLLMLK